MNEKIKEFDKGSFHFVVHSELDEYPDLSWLGEYTDKEPDAFYFDRRNGLFCGETTYKTVTDDEGYEEEEAEVETLALALPTEHDSRTYRYFVPANPPKNSKDTDLIKGAIADYERMEEYNRGYWNMQGIVVTMFMDGKELASSSLWGIESDVDDDYLNEVIDDLTSDCITEAKKKVDVYHNIANELASLQE